MFDASTLPNGGIFIPAKQDSKWLLVALHGSNGSAQNYEGLDEIFAIDALNYLYVNGPIPSFSNYRWYSDPLTRRDCIPYLERIFKSLEGAGFPPEKTFLLGISQGAALTFEFGSQYPKVLAGYIPLSGRVEGLPALLNLANKEVISKADWFVTHGTKDFNLSPQIMRDQVEALREAGYRIEYREYDKIHEFDSEKELPEIGEWIRGKMGV